MQEEPLKARSLKIPLLIVVILLLCALGGLAYVISALMNSKNELDDLHKKFDEKSFNIPANDSSKIPTPEEEGDADKSNTDD